MGGFVVLGIYSLFVEAPWRIDLMSVSFQTYAAVLYLGICSTFIAWLMYIRLIRECGAVQATAVLYVMPLVSILLDWFFLDKTISLANAVGVGVILAGVWLIQKAPKAVLPKIHT